MSLVGPRPLLPEYLPHYTAEENRRHLVKPGLTGWAQVHGRNELSWEEKFRLDVWYVDHASPALDTAVLLKTVRKVVKRDGISQAGHATAPKLDEMRRAAATTASNAADPRREPAPISAAAGAPRPQRSLAR